MNSEIVNGLGAVTLFSYLFTVQGLLIAWATHLWKNNEHNYVSNIIYGLVFLWASTVIRLVAAAQYNMAHPVVPPDLSMLEFAVDYVTAIMTRAPIYASGVCVMIAMLRLYRTKAVRFFCWLGMSCFFVWLVTFLVFNNTKWI